MKWFPHKRSITQYGYLTDNTQLDTVNKFLQTFPTEHRSDPIPPVCGELDDNMCPAVSTAMNAGNLVGAGWVGIDYNGAAGFGNDVQRMRQFFAAFAVIHQIGVDPQWRGQGIGRQLIAELERVLRQREVKMVAAVYRPSKELTNFYNSLGYQTGRSQLDAPIDAVRKIRLPVDAPDKWAYKNL